MTRRARRECVRTEQQPWAQGAGRSTHPHNLVVSLQHVRRRRRHGRRRLHRLGGGRERRCGRWFAPLRQRHPVLLRPLRDCDPQRVVGNHLGVALPTRGETGRRHARAHAPAARSSTGTSGGLLPASGLWTSGRRTCLARRVRWTERRFAASPAVRNRERCAPVANTTGSTMSSIVIGHTKCAGGAKEATTSPPSTPALGVIAANTSNAQRDTAAPRLR